MKKIFFKILTFITSFRSQTKTKFEKKKVDKDKQDEVTKDIYPLF